MKLFYTFMFIVSCCHAARILGIIPTPSYSHQVFYQPLWKELASRGHELVLLTTDPIKNASLTTLKEIDMHDAYKIWNRNILSTIEKKDNPLASMFLMVDTLDEILEWELALPEVQEIIKNETEYFDVVMIEYMMPPMFAFKTRFCHVCCTLVRFNCPFIGLTSLDASYYAHRAVGNPTHSLMYPDAIFGFENPNFLQRMIIILMGYGIEMLAMFRMVPRERLIIDKYFGLGYPELIDIGESVDMLFINANPVFSVNRPLSPATINIGGGIHIKPLAPLPKDLAQYLDAAKEGVVYFSLGTNVKSKDIPNRTKELLLKVFAQLPYKVLWKFESEELPGKPDNVKIIKWAPQQDILRHPNVKVFITQCGIQSLEESLFSNVPIVGIPFFADQHSNAQKVLRQGLGLIDNYETMTVEGFKEILLDVIQNPKYRNRVKYLASLVQDEPMSGLEKAVFWTEYVLRHKGAQHLKGPKNLPFYQFYYLDIITFLSVLGGFITFSTWFIIKKIVSLIFKIINKNKAKTD